MSEDARFMYLRHPSNSASVLTVARVLEDDTITFAWSLNKFLFHDQQDELDTRLRQIMSRQEFLALRKKWRANQPFDIWDKRVGRDIALGRLVTDHAISIPYEKGNVARTVLAALMADIPNPERSTAYQIASLTLDHWDTQQRTA
jgi:hypothetical protein